MEFPESFRQLAMNMLLILFREEREPADRKLEEVLAGIDAQGRKELFDYLRVILDGRYDDGQLDQLWFRTGTDMMFRNQRDTRRFLAAVRDEMAKTYGAS